MPQILFLTDFRHDFSFPPFKPVEISHWYQWEQEQAFLLQAVADWSLAPLWLRFAEIYGSNPMRLRMHAADYSLSIAQIIHSPDTSTRYMAISCDTRGFNQICSVKDEQWTEVQRFKLTESKQKIPSNSLHVEPDVGAYGFTNILQNFYKYLF